MFDLDHAIAEWRRQILAAGLKTPEVLDELESHLRDDVAQRMHSGLCAEEAFKCAVEQIGEASLLKREFTKAGAARESRFRKLVIGFTIANILFGALSMFGVVLDLANTYKNWGRVSHYGDDLWFMRLYRSLIYYDAICCLIGIVAAIQLCLRKRSAITLGTIYTLLAVVGILANTWLSAWAWGFNGRSVLVTLLFLAYPIMFFLLCQNSRLKEQYV